MKQPLKKHTFCPPRSASERPTRSELLRKVRVAVCGNLPDACNYLSRLGVIHIDQYSDAVNLRCEADYHLILVYAPQGEGLINTMVLCNGGDGGASHAIPMRLLNEPCCHSALLELKLTVQKIASEITEAEPNSPKASILYSDDGHVPYRNCYSTEDTV